MKEDFIDKALNTLLTPDGKGKTKKAHMLAELCQTQNPNYVRERIEKLIKEKQLA